MTVSAYFFVLNQVLYRTHPVPFKIRNMEDAGEKWLTFWKHVASYSSMIHAVVSFVLSLIVVLEVGMRYNQENLREEVLVLCFSLGYFINDTIYGYITKYNDVFLFAHHIICVSALLYVIIRGDNGNVIIWALIVTEISNPFLIIRQNAQMHKKLEQLSTITGIIFAFVFVFARTIGIGICFMPLFRLPTPLILKMLGSSLWYLSLNWCYMIINLFFKSMVSISDNPFFTKTNENLRELRKNNSFIYSLHFTLISIAYSPILVFWNHESII